jgi:conjugal transfer pilus assembly protein TraE
MDLSISHGQAQRLLKQRNLLAITATGLFALSVVLTLTAAQAATARSCCSRCWRSR